MGPLEHLGELMAYQRALGVEFDPAWNEAVELVLEGLKRRDATPRVERGARGLTQRLAGRLRG